MKWKFSSLFPVDPPVRLLTLSAFEKKLPGLAHALLGETHLRSETKLLGKGAGKYHPNNPEHHDPTISE